MSASSPGESSAGSRTKTAAGSRTKTAAARTLLVLLLSLGSVALVASASGPRWLGMLGTIVGVAGLAAGVRARRRAPASAWAAGALLFAVLAVAAELLLVAIGRM